MEQDIFILIITAITIGFVHTILGPDHYLPFIVMAKAKNWNRMKTTLVTTICGLGHVGSSIILGIIGIIFGIGINQLEVFESFRGNLAAWLFIAFGLVYLIWGLKKALKNKPHKHIHFHSNGSEHIHEHTHHEEHARMCAS